MYKSEMVDEGTSIKSHYHYLVTPLKIFTIQLLMNKKGGELGKSLCKSIPHVEPDKPNNKATVHLEHI